VAQLLIMPVHDVTLSLEVKSDFLFGNDKYIVDEKDRRKFFKKSVELRPLQKLPNSPRPRSWKAFGSGNDATVARRVKYEVHENVISLFIQNKWIEFVKWISKSNYVDPQFVGFLMRQAYFQYHGAELVSQIARNQTDYTWTSDDDYKLGIYAMSILGKKHRSEKDKEIMEWINNYDKFDSPATCGLISSICTILCEGGDKYYVSSECWEDKNVFNLTKIMNQIKKKEDKCAKGKNKGEDANESTSGNDE